MPARKKPTEFEVRAENLLPLEEKLAKIRRSLLEDLPAAELSRLQVHSQLLENALTNAANYHHHDTNQHHDHETYMLTPGLEPRALQERQ